MFTFTISEEIILKSLYFEDSEELFELTTSNRVHLSNWLPWVEKSKTTKDSRSFIEFTLEKYAKNDGIHAGIWHHNRLAGVIGHHGINQSNKSTSLGYWLGEKFQGNGLVTSSVKAFTRYTFEKMDLNRIEIRCATENTKSRSIPEKLGFQLEGISRQSERINSGYVDHAVYSLLKEEWIKF